MSNPITEFFGDTTFDGTPRVQQTRIRPEDWEPPAGATREEFVYPTLVGTFVAHSPQWHAARKDRLGGSEIAAAVGLSKWESRYSLWHRKQGGLPEEEPSTPIDWGNRLEDVVAEHFARRHPDMGVVKAGTYHHADRPWQLANPDRLGVGAAHPPVVEIKTALYDYAWGPDGSDEVPIYYRAQVMWYMDVLGADVAHFAVLIGGHDYREYTVPYDLADALYLREQGQAFMASLRDGVEPAVDDHVRSKVAMEHLHPELDDRLDVPVTREQAMAFVTAEREKDAAMAVWDGERARMIQTMGKARRAMLGDVTVATRLPSSAGKIYVKGHPGWKAKAPKPAAPTSATDAAMKGIEALHAPEAEAHARSAGDGILAAADSKVQLRSLDELLATCSRRSDVVAVMALFPDPSEEQRAKGNAAWSALPKDDKR